MGIVWSKVNFEDHRIFIANHVGGVPNTFKRNQSTESYQSFAVNAGVGVKYFLSENVALRLEARDTCAFKDADFGQDKSPCHNITVTGGLIF